MSVSALSIPGSLNLLTSVSAITSITQTVHASYQEVARDATVSETDVAKYIMVTADVNSKVSLYNPNAAGDDSFKLATFKVTSTSQNGDAGAEYIGWSNEQIVLPLISATDPALTVGKVTLANTVNQQNQAEVTVEQNGTNGAEYNVTMTITSVASGLMEAKMFISGNKATCTAVDDITQAQKVAAVADGSFAKTDADVLTLEVTAAGIEHFPDTNIGGQATIGAALDHIKAQYDGKSVVQSWTGSFDEIDENDGALFESFSAAARKDVAAKIALAGAANTARPFNEGTKFMANQPQSLTLTIDNIDDEQGNPTQPTVLIPATDVFMIVKQSA